MFKFLILFLLIESYERCHPNCEKCFTYSIDERDMGCITCKEGYNFLEYTNNCVDIEKYPNYYSNYTGDTIRIFPCSNFPELHCEECFMNDSFQVDCYSCQYGIH